MRHFLDSTKEQIVGKTLESVDRIDDSSVLIKFGDATQCQLSVEGDCCSHSIFYEIEMFRFHKGSIIEDVLEKGWDDDSESKKTADTEAVALEKVKKAGFDFHPEENSVWNVILKTNKGNVLIRHINSSNGYYDGDTFYRFLDSNGKPLELENTNLPFQNIGPVKASKLEDLIQKNGPITGLYHG